METEDLKMIPVFKPAYDDQEWHALREPLMSGWVGLGPKTKAFEEAFAAYVGAPYAVGMNSGTAALHLGLKILNVEGGEVITTPMTFVSTNHAILYNNARPIFADIEEDTLNIDPNLIEPLITSNTRAIMCVHYGGHSCDMDKIRVVAVAHGLPVIEDAAHACGAMYRGRRIGSISEVTCFSFHAVKNLATGEGGMVTIKDPDQGALLRRLRWMGIDKTTYDRSIVKERYSWYYTVEEIGYKYHMSDIAASLGLVQLGKLERLNARRREIVQIYNQELSNLDWLRTPVEKDYATSSCHNYVVKIEDGRREKFIQHMAEKGVATSVHYIPNHLYSMYQSYRTFLPVAERIWRRIVTLPLFPDLTNEQIDYIVECIQEFGKRG
jgi:perosamine synthetase